MQEDTVQPARARVNRRGWLMRAPFVATAALAACAATPAEGGDAVALIAATVLPMEGELVLRDHTLLVRRGRIAALGPSATTPVPPDARRIDARGKFLLPGLAEMHGHVAGPPALLERILFLYLSNGITTVRGMLGQPAHLALREQAARGEILGPTLYTSGPSLNGNTVPDPETGARLVAQQKAAGYDLLKIHPGLSRPSYDAIAAAARAHRIPFAGHVPTDVGLLHALRAGQASIDHLDGYVEAMLRDGAQPPPSGLFGLNLLPWVDEAKLPALVAATRAAGAWNVVTQSLIEHLAGPESPAALAARPEMRYMPRATVMQWQLQAQGLRSSPGFTQENASRFIELRRRILRALHAGGAGLLLGSDAPQIFNVPGFSMQHEMRMMVAAGLTPWQVLAMGTRNAAAYFGAQGEFGTISRGSRADLLLLDADPLRDIANMAQVAGVMVRGRWLAAGEIRERLEALAAG